MDKPTCTIWEDGTKQWYLNGKLHREDGPAAEYADGTKAWYLNDKLHREDGPAVELLSGSKRWYLNDKLHREDGPAIEYADGTKHWYLNDRELAEHEFDTQLFIKWVKRGGEELYEKEITSADDNIKDCLC